MTLSETLNNIAIEESKSIQGLHEEFAKFEQDQITARDVKALKLQEKESTIRVESQKKTQQVLADFDKKLEIATRDDEGDSYSIMTVKEMMKFASKPKNLAKANELGVKVEKSWTEEKICKAIYNYFN